MSEANQNSVNVFKLAVALGLLSAVATAALVGVFILTKGPIEKQKSKATNDALKLVLPPFDNSPVEHKIVIGKDEEGNTVVGLGTKLKADGTLVKLKNIITIYPAKEGGKIVGYAGEGVSPRGFGGDIKAMVGLDTNGTFNVGIITSNQETPGLGTVITDRVDSKTIFDVLGMSDKQPSTGLPSNKILDQFKGKIATNKPWQVKKDGGDVDYVTGATITSRAVTDVFYKITYAFVSNKEKIIALATQNN